MSAAGQTHITAFAAYLAGERNYAPMLHEDLDLRFELKKRLSHAGVAKIDMERAACAASSIANVLPTPGEAPRKIFSRPRPARTASCCQRSGMTRF